jgi:predicted metal-binding protein
LITNGASARTTVLVCLTCRSAGDALDAPRSGTALARATSDALGDATDVRVQGIKCLANCGRGLSAAIRRANGWTYIFGGLEAHRDGQTLIAGARLFASSSDGLMPWRGRPEPLKRGMIARLPPVDFEGETP